MSLKEMVEQLEISIGKKADLRILPMQPGDVACTYADISKAKRVIGYDPKVIFSDGIDMFVDWYKTFFTNLGETNILN